MYAPKPLWSEQEPEDWWRAVGVATRKAMKAAKITSGQVTGVGLSGQMHGSVFLDPRGKVIRKALLWNDQRTVAECREIETRAGGKDRLIDWVSNDALSGFTAPKILWLRHHEPVRFARLRHVLLPKDFIRYRLTQEIATDVGDASGTLLLDVKRRAWSNPMLQALGLDESLLPKTVEACEVTGRITREASRVVGGLEGIPVVAGSGDQPCGALGMGILSEGTVSATIGTSGVVFAATKTPHPNSQGVLQSFCHAIPNQWSVFGCMLSAGDAAEWARATLLPGVDRETGFRQLFQGATKVEAALEGLFFLPYLQGERCPYPNPTARGAWIGLRPHHTPAHLFRAVLEGVAFGMRDQITLLKKDFPIREVRLAGGGAASPLWRALQSEIYGIPATALDTPHASALGAAILAGIGTGLWSSYEEACAKVVHPRKVRAPKASRIEAYAEKHAQYQSLYPLLRPFFDASR